MKIFVGDCLFVLAVMLLPMQVACGENSLHPLPSSRSAGSPAQLPFASASEDDHENGLEHQFRDHDHQDVRGGFFEELFEPAVHSHFTRRGTPLVHLFLTEPAVLHRDLFFDYRIGNNVEGSTDEQELEVELEWSLTKRLGMVIEVPYVGLDPVGSPNTSGFGDIAVAGRALLVDQDWFFLSANLAVGIPTGDADRDLGRGEAALAPTITTWLDLGNWTALHGQFGPEIGLQTGDTEFVHHLALTRSFQGPVLFESGCRRGRNGSESDGDEHQEHFEPGFTSLILEMTGVTGLGGDGAGQTFIELLPGIAYTPVEGIELRFGVRFPLFKPTRIDTQYIFTVARVF